MRAFACTGPSSIGDQSESEDDDYLAAAVAAVEAKQGKGGKKGKVKHPHLRALRSKLGSISRSKDKEGSGSTQADAASPTSDQVRQEVALQKTINTSVLLTNDKEGSGSTHADAASPTSDQVRQQNSCVE